MCSAPPYTVISAHSLKSEDRSHFSPNQPARVGITNQRIPRKKKKAQNSLHSQCPASNNSMLFGGTVLHLVWVPVPRHLESTLQFAFTFSFTKKFCCLPQRQNYSHLSALPAMLHLGIVTTGTAPTFPTSFDTSQP